MNFFKRLWIRFLLAHNRTSDREIRSLFGYLAQLDSDSFVDVYPGVQVLGYAAFVHVRAGSDQFTVSNSTTGQIVVQEKRDKLQIDKYYPHFPTRSPWRYAYRSGEILRSVRFVTQLRALRLNIRLKHLRMSTELEEKKFVIQQDDTFFVLDECVFSTESPGFILRSKADPKIFMSLTYADALNALKEVPCESPACDAV